MGLEGDMGVSIGLGLRFVSWAARAGGAVDPMGD